MSGFSGTVSLTTQKRKEQEALTEGLHCKTFRVWVNQQLNSKGYPPVQDLLESLSHGVSLIHLVQSLYGGTVNGKYTTDPTTEIQKVENVAIALQFLQEKGLTLQINSKDITDCNRKLVLGLLWMLIQTRQMLSPEDEGKSATQRNKQAKGNLLSFCKKQTEGYQGVSIEDLSTSFHDGMAFAALVHSIQPDLLDWKLISKDNPLQNHQLAFEAAEKLGIPSMLDPQDMCNPDVALRPDERCIMTYISEFPLAYIKTNHKTAAPVVNTEELEAKRRLAEEEAKRNAEQLRIEHEKAHQAVAELSKQANTNADALKARNEEIAQDNLRLQEELERMTKKNEQLQADLMAIKNKLIGKLSVGVKEARDLLGFDVGGKSDPYVRVKLEGQEYKTKTKKKTLTPKWDQDFEFYVTDKRSELEVVVWDWDRFSKDDFMGKITLKVADLADGHNKEEWYTLLPMQSGNKVAGSILLHINFQMGK